MHLNSVFFSRFSVFLIATFIVGNPGNEPTKSSHPHPHGVTTPGIQRTMADGHTEAIFAVDDKPDWLGGSSDAVWVSRFKVDKWLRLDSVTNQTSLFFIID